MHHQWRVSELQEAPSVLRGVPTRRTTEDGASRGFRPRRGAPLWAWLLLAALLVPGAWSFLNEEQEELLVELHNHYRGQVSPSASAMLPLRWDPSLQLVAEGYAAKCIWNHNPELEDTGENLYAGTGALDLREALEKWFLEHLDYDFQNNSCDEDKMCGHYTQMVWADTHRVGCALHLCNNMEGLDWERVSFLVCNYYPAGNYEDERPFVEGDWCSRCPENLQKCENNLCVADTVEDEDEDEDEDEIVFPPAATSDPSLQPDVEEKVPPSETTTYVPPATTVTTAAAEAATTTPSIPTTTTTTTTTTSEDAPPAATPAPGTRPPKVPSTTLEKEEKKKEEEEEERKKTIEKTEGEGNVTRKNKFHKEISTASAASVSSPSLLLACLTGILTLRPWW